MEISGHIRANCAPEVLTTALEDPRTIERLLPAGAEVRLEEPGRFSFTISKTFGPIKLTLPGNLTIAPGAGSHDRKLVVRAAHVIGGKVDLDMDLTLEDHGGATKLGYQGQLAATGLAGRILKEHRGRVGSVVKAGMTRLKMFAEGRARQGA